MSLETECVTRIRHLLLMIDAKDVVCVIVDVLSEIILAGAVDVFVEIQLIVCCDSKDFQRVRCPNNMSENDPPVLKS